MTTPNTFLGAGVSPFGTTFAGTGSPAQQNIKRLIWKDIYGNQQNARLIDPITRDYSFDEYGYSMGMTDIQQLVYLALVTTKNSSIISNMGVDYYNSQVIKSNYITQITEDVNQALKTLINERKVILNSVNVAKNGPNQLMVVVKWTDATRNLAFANII